MSSKVLRGGERKRRRRRRRRERGANGVALQTSPATCRHPGVTGLFPGLPEKGGLELGPTGIRVLCQEEVISLQSSAQAEAFRPNPCVQDRGIRKTGRREGPRRGQREGRGERSIRSCSLLVGALWPVVCVRRRPGTKGPQLRLLGLVHWQASWPLSTPSGQDVSLSEEESPPVAGRGTPSRARD